MLSIARSDVELRLVRWFLQTPERRAAGRPSRADPPIVAALPTPRNNFATGGGQKLRIGNGLSAANDSCPPF
jgi:hypothetical protein